MRETNIVELKNNLSKILSFVENGEKIQICRRNTPIAYLVPLETKKQKNKTRLGCGLGTAQITSDLTEPMIPEDSWEMLEG